MKVYSMAFMAAVGWCMGKYASHLVIEMIEDLPETDFWQHKVLKVDDSKKKSQTKQTIGFAIPDEES